MNEFISVTIKIIYRAFAFPSLEEMYLCLFISSEAIICCHFKSIAVLISISIKQTHATHRVCNNSGAVFMMYLQ